MGVSAAAGVVASGRVPMVFMGLTSGGAASEGIPPLAGDEFSGVFPEFMVAGGFNVGLVLKPFIFAVLSSTRVFLRLGVQTRLEKYILLHYNTHLHGLPPKQSSLQ